MEIQKNFFDLNYEQLKGFLSKEIGIEEKKLNMRSQQIFTAVYQKNLNNFQNLTTIPIDLRKKLNTKLSLNNLEVVETHNSSDGTKKFLVKLSDGNKVECVYIPEKKKRYNLYFITSRV